MRLQTDHLTLGYGRLTVVPDLSLDVLDGKITSLVGRNGCGKSTLLRAMGRLLKPQRGAVVLDGTAIATASTREVAQKLAVLPQGPTAPEGMTVRDLVEQGRYPYRDFFGVRSDDDRRLVAWALEQTGMAEFAARPLESLSGGQRQRGWIAMALAQDTGIMLLDEPTTFLDVAYQLELMELLRDLNAKHGRTILMVLHDLNQAAHYSHHLIAMKDGAIYAAGSPRDVLTAKMVRDVFGVEADITADARSGSPLCIPHGLAPGAVAPEGEFEAAAAAVAHEGARA